MPAPKQQRVVPPPTYIYVRVTRFGVEMARDKRDAQAWHRVGVPVWRYRVDGKAGEGEITGEESPLSTLRGD